MLIERHVAPYVVDTEDTVLQALEAVTANRARIVFVVTGDGHLEGAMSDGDFRRWVSANGSTVDLEAPVLTVANRAVRSAHERTPPGDVRPLFGDGVGHVPLVDDLGRLVAIAVDTGDELRIGRHAVGPGRPALMVSEIGINHQGSVAFAKELVDRSVEAGADVVKFQLRDLDATYRQADGASAGEDLGPQYTLDLLARYNLSANQLAQVFDHARAAGVGLMCTAWDPLSVDRLAEYGVDALKVASADLTNHDLLRRMAATGLPMVVSTGMATEGEIRESVAVLRETGVAYSLLHCQSTYPAPYKDVNLRYLQRLAEIGRCPVGYSGHERGFHVPLAAVALGAVVVEKHFTTDRDLEGNDHKVSLLPDEFAAMVRRVRELEEAMGSNAPRSVSTGERMNRVNLAKSLVAARPVAAGETIAADAVDVRSPGRGLQPNALDRLVGRTARRDLAAGDYFYAADLEEGGARARRYRFRRPWGLPVRYHDAGPLAAMSNPDFLELHLSYKDLEIDPAGVFTERQPLGLAVHSPDLFAGDFLLNLASSDDDHWRRSIAELQRVVDLTRALTPRFTLDDAPVVIASLGGFTHDAHLHPSQLPALYERVADGLAQVDDAGVRLCAQTLPPYPWYLGGQLYCNLFVRPDDTAAFARAHERRLVLDVSHSRLAATWLDVPFTEVVDTLAPHTEHLHLVDATGVDGEGVQVGEGDVDWPVLAEQLDRLAPRAGFIPEIWQGHVNDGEGFWTALERLEEWF
ncbi:acetylneuraminic acid synthetase [Marmoricola endophyticus]|uniref:Acetylneuraminic acid synthetase n=1 Tax=Marmoricola endophyticus TaxID=2040280 RepID=A0A917BMI9_9ACTN|nr:N-acetylneuraminate synthase family protein [Marmoricola endophyticus]GGF51710.1 acetylneuraminic acid synthetase [Marmoricola endophyticus]